jgi:hypothetical protein
MSSMMRIGYRIRENELNNATTDTRKRKRKAPRNGIRSAATFTLSLHGPWTLRYRDNISRTADVAYTLSQFTTNGPPSPREHITIALGGGDLERVWIYSRGTCSASGSPKVHQHRASRHIASLSRIPKALRSEVA